MAVVVAALLVLAGCTPDDGPSGAPSSPTPSTSATSTSPSLTATLATPGPAAVVLPAATAESAALEASQTVFAQAPVVALAAADDPAAQAVAATTATTVGAPLLLTGPAVPPPVLLDELDRLGTRWVLAHGAADLAVPAGVTVLHPDAAPSPAPTAASTPAPTPTQTPTPTPASLPRAARPEPVEGTVALTGVGAAPVAALATIAAAGIPVVDVPGGDPRATSAGVQALAAHHPAHVVAVGAAFGDPALLASRVATASSGQLAPGGGQLVFPQVPGLPGKRYFALYGTPGLPALGVLGEQDVPATVARAQAHADAFRTLTGDTVVPAVEIIATVASAAPEPDGSYSRAIPVETLRPLVEAAGAAGLAVVLDLQPGRTDFLTQAQQYSDLLALPYVGLALDPEWRLAPDQVHLRQIGSVGVDEINAVAAWLADLTRQRGLPQKMFVVHQFSLRMVDGRERLDTSHDELAVVIHVDGQGTQPAKAGTWATLRAGAPPVHWGWKNFYDEDQPMLDPAQTYAVQPVPDLVTYQ
ncbi:hypothetical protein Cch01nite_06980 [Cellulomonas chitinilytica]|uniref:Lipoprotein n=1 Tax=Cellulomonas chitinilytica TaxID=398759 RepID=A0A919U1B0_9CELL|nr:hypothetical protein Cch01nite_06980 [Cellulomonas chitinilytica]